MPAAAEVGDDEALASFVLESNKFKSDGAVDHRQLMPSNRHKNTSVFRIDGLQHADTVALGNAEVAVKRGKPGVLGWVLLRAGTVREVRPLTVIPKEPPPKHALVENWPPPEQWRTLALLLASKAQSVRV